MIKILPPNEFFDPNSAICLSKVAAPTSIILSFKRLMYENFELNLITIPLIPPSLIRVFEPAPKTWISFSFKSFKKLAKSVILEGLKNIFAGPPRLNQLYFDKFSLFKIFPRNYF